MDGERWAERRERSLEVIVAAWTKLHRRRMPPVDSTLSAGQRALWSQLVDGHPYEYRARLGPVSDVFVDPHNENRRRFYVALAELVPEAMRELGELRPLLLDSIRRNVPDQPGENWAPDVQEILVPVLTPLFVWANTHHLPQEWIFRDALAFLINAPPDGVMTPVDDNLDPDVPEAVVTITPAVVPPFIWRLQEMPRSVVETVLLKQFAQGMQQALDAAEAQARAAGLTMQDLISQHDARRVVRRRVKGLEPRRILKEEHDENPDADPEADPEADPNVDDRLRGVRKSINRALRLLELPLEPSRRREKENSPEVIPDARGE